MTPHNFRTQLRRLFDEHETLLARPNRPQAGGNGIYDRFIHPVLSAEHTPLEWRYDFDHSTNPSLMTRLGVNCVFNAGAIEFDGAIVLMARVEGWDRKSFFAVAESRNGVDGFRFHDYPVQIPELDGRETNLYDMRLVKHEDGWIYGVFCAERHDDSKPSDPSAAIARCGIARTRDLSTWERLPDLKTSAPHQRNCVLHPEFVDGKYAFYTRPTSDFAATGAGPGIGWGICYDIRKPEIATETIIDPLCYHTIKEGKNGLGPAPLRTPAGWLHLAHGVRHTASGMRYVLYAFLCDLERPWLQIATPGGMLIGPQGMERTGDVSNVVFSNGWVARENGDLFIYYGSSDSLTHVAKTSVEKVLDYVQNTPPDAGRTRLCVEQRCALIARNRETMMSWSRDTETASSTLIEGDVRRTALSPHFR